MRDIVRMLNKFTSRRVPYISKYLLKAPTHEPIIGEWVRWWTEDTRTKGAGEKRAVLCPGTKATYRSQVRTADILFLEKMSGQASYKIKGVAEIESAYSKLKNKLQTLKFYEKYRLRGRRPYKDLQFAILSMTLKVKQEIKKSSDINREEIRRDLDPIIKKAQELSRNSKLTWVVYVLFSVPNTGKCSYDILAPEYYPDSETYYWREKYGPCAYYVMIDKGKIDYKCFTISSQTSTNGIVLRTVVWRRRRS